MGIIKAVMNSIGGGLADSYLECFRPGPMGRTTVVVPGVFRDAGQNRNTNTKRLNNVISNGSIIEVGPGQLMCVVDGGRVVDYSAEPGYFQVSNSSVPSFFNGKESIMPAIRESLDRIRFGGNEYHEQRVVYINLRTIEGIKFGTRTPVPFYDEKYKIDVAVRANGQFSIKIVDPWKFFNEVIPSECVTDGVALDAERFINETFMSEFLGALGEALSGISCDGIPLSRIPTQTTKVSQYMANALDSVWKESRGIEIQNVGFNSLTYDEDTRKLLQRRNDAAIYTDPSIQQAFINTSIARGIEAAGSNSGGATVGFMGMNMAMNAGGNFMGQVNNTLQQQQMQQQAAQQQAAQQQAAQQQAAQQQAAAQNGWKCSCGHSGNTGKFCAECGAPKPTESSSWKCPSCGAENTGKFCAECGGKKPVDKPKKVKCDKCGFEPDISQAIPKFCPNCGDPINEADYL